MRQIQNELNILQGQQQGGLTTYDDSVNAYPGKVQYYFEHTIRFPEGAKTHLLTYVKWYKSAPSSSIQFKHNFMEPEISNTKLWKAEYFQEAHQRENNPSRKVYCQICYPPILVASLTVEFLCFWQQIHIHHNAELCTGVTVAIFQLITQNIQTAELKYQEFAIVPKDLKIWKLH
ncbi:hypothetical protein C1645_829104 [Glomus cerebriforme]|uniref:Uncharacterized protein n=1 Tax=Glomus cerebriforme TaxID=658196 RepID=A0A397SNT0_9GLOM|nr:hypothetical protein C1645_829104 [Glomus cerebriforme]